MKKITLLVAALALSLTAMAQETESKAEIPAAVTVSAKGTDVRGVIHDMFVQQKKSYVLDPEVKYNLYLSLEKVDFDEALMIVCQSAGLEHKVQNGIYYIAKKAVKKDPPKAEEKPKSDSVKTQAPTQSVKPTGMLPISVLSAKVNTRLDKTDIRAVFAELASQADVTIEVDKNVPKYRLDAYLKNTSLKYALDVITGKTGLGYKLTNNMSILIYKKQDDDNHVSVVGG